MLHQVLINGVDKTDFVHGWTAEQAVTYNARSANIEFSKDISPAPKVNDEVELRGAYGAGYAVRHNGSNSYLTVPSFQFPNAQKFAITFWIKAYPKASYAYEGVVAHPGLFDGTASLTIENPAFTGVFRIFDALETEYSLSYDGLYDENAWTFVVVQYTGSQMQIWKNAQLVATRDVSVTLRTPTRDLKLCSHGYGGSGGDIHITMELDEFRVYDRSLSPSEILALYHGEHVGSGLFLWFPHDEGSGSTVEDKAGGRTGTLSGGYTWISGCPVSTRLHTVFKGVIARITRRTFERTFVALALDYTYFLFFRMIFGKSYVQKKAHEIIQDLLSTYIPDITTNGVATNFTYDFDKTFDQETVFDAIRYLAEVEGADFWVTASKDLYFKKREDAPTAPVSLIEGDNILAAEEEKSGEKLSNYVKILGGEGFKPADQDAWTEGSGWAADAPLSYDTSVKYAGTCSVKVSGGGFSLYYPATKDLGLLIKNYYTKLYWAQRTSALPSSYRISLHKDDTNYAYRDVAFGSANAWEEKSVDVGTGSSGWTTVGSFDWASDPVNFVRFRYLGPLDTTFYDYRPAAGYLYRIHAGGITRAGERLTIGPGAVLSVTFHLRRVGNPTGLAYVRVRGASNDEVLGTIGSIDVSTISTYGERYTFSGGYANLSQATDVRVAFEYNGGDANNYINFYTYINSPSGVFTIYQTSWIDYGSEDADGVFTGSGIKDLWIDGLYFYTPQIEIEASDSESQASYRRRDFFKSDTTITDSRWASSWADLYLSDYKEPYSFLKVTAKFLPGQIEAGQKVSVTIGSLGINNAIYRILKAVIKVPEASTELELCPVLPYSFEEKFAQTDRELQDVIRRTS